MLPLNVSNGILTGFYRSFTAIVRISFRSYFEVRIGRDIRAPPQVLKWEYEKLLGAQ